MTSLLPGPASAQAADRADARHRRPLVLVALLGGTAAALATLLVCLAAGVVGWFLTDAGVHGTPRDGLRVGALGWLLAHGSGLHVDGVAVTVVPLGLTALAAWAVWRLGHRVGDSISGHGPDAERIADGERDWTVPTATLAFTAGYVAVAILTLRLAGTPGTAPSLARVLLWSLVLCLTFGLAAISTGSGRAAIWAATLPPSVRASAVTSLRVLGAYLVVASAFLVGALVVDFDTAVNVMSRLHTDAGDATIYTVLSATVLPNATIFSASYLLGPGFAVGLDTLVSPTLVSLGPLPMFPLLAALPDAGPTPAWTAYVVGLAPVVAALAAARAQRRSPTLRWDEGALRGCAGGVLAGVLLGLLAAVAGGSVGPGRMTEVGPFAFDVMVHAITAFGVGGLVGGVLMTWWQRRVARRASLDSLG
ncbi:cell division protein PerM [Nocardioides pyridinolyticus]